MYRIAILVALFLLCVPCSAFRITEFCPDPYLPDDADEYLIISGYGPLDGLAISDGEGGFRFPPGTISGGKITVARSAVAFNLTHGYLPDFEWYSTSAAVPDVISGDKLRMANTNDELMVYDHTTLLQQVAWPADVKSREGQIHYLEAGIWDRRPLFIGQSRFTPSTFENVTVTAFVSPDSAGEIFASALASARMSVQVNVYEFTSAAIAQSLVEAKQRGADVLVLVEGGPVGGISKEEKAVISMMNRSGIPVFMMVAAGETRALYRFDHAKYVVIDNRSLLLTSENFKASGIPPAGRKGNRGWGVYLEDPALAAYFGNLFISDVRTKNSIPIAGKSGLNESSIVYPYTAEFFPQQFSGARVYPVIAPDTSYLILDLIEGAEDSIVVEQAYITNETATSLNPYLSAAINASRRGVKVRVLLDSYWYNVEEEKDNDEMATLINRIAAAEHLTLEARCAEIDLNNLEKIHNKGVIVDNRSVLISSINWNSNSPNFNREAGVIIDHPGIAQYYLDVFEDDWNPKVPRQETVQDSLKLLCLATVALFLIILYVRKVRSR